MCVGSIEVNEESFMFIINDASSAYPEIANEVARHGAAIRYLGQGDAEVKSVNGDTCVLLHVALQKLALKMNA